MLKKLFSHTAIYGLAPQITKIASFFSLPLITAELTDLDYGIAGIMTAYTASISVLAALGLKVVLVNSFFKSPAHIMGVAPDIWFLIYLEYFLCHYIKCINLPGNPYQRLEKMNGLYYY